jgi:hypothetical protein
MYGDALVHSIVNPSSENKGFSSDMSTIEPILSRDKKRVGVSSGILSLLPSASRTNPKAAK